MTIATLTRGAAACLVLYVAPALANAQTQDGGLRELGKLQAIGDCDGVKQFEQDFPQTKARAQLQTLRTRYCSPLTVPDRPAVKPKPRRQAPVLAKATPQPKILPKPTPLPVPAVVAPQPKIQPAPVPAVVQLHPTAQAPINCRWMADETLQCLIHQTWKTIDPKFLNNPYKSDPDYLRLEDVALAQGGDFNASFRLGAFYQDLSRLRSDVFPLTERDYTLVDRDSKLAVDWYRFAESKGSTKAQVALGFYYQYGGAGIKPSRAEAVKRYTDAAGKGESMAYEQLGKLFELQPINDVERAFAITWLSLAADRGFVESQYLLGNKFLNGLRVPKDESKGIYWLKRAAKYNHPKAQEILRARNLTW
jgi:hypothetical protein